jgi:hypothetical protein
MNRETMEESGHYPGISLKRVGQAIVRNGKIFSDHRSLSSEQKLKFSELSHREIFKSR